MSAIETQLKNSKFYLIFANFLEVFMLQVLNNSVNKNVRAIGKVLSQIDKNYKNISSVKVTTDIFHNDAYIDFPQEIKIIIINVCEDYYLKKIKQEMECAKEYLSKDTKIVYSLNNKVV